MDPNDAPRIRSALDDIRPLIPQLWYGFDAATTRARQIIDALREELGAGSAVYDPYLFPHIVRYRMKLFLGLRGLQVDYDLDDLPSSGLRFRYRNWVIRLRKAALDGGLPEMNGSNSMKDFVQGMLSDEFALAGDNLLILWIATAQGNFSGLALAYRQGKGANATILNYIELDNPIEADMFPTFEQSSADFSEDAADLPYYEPEADEDEAERGNDAEQA